VAVTDGREAPLGGLPDVAQELVDAAARGDKLAAWQAAAQLLGWLGDLGHPLDAAASYSLVWRGAARYRWFDMAELLAGAVASRADATPAQRRLHAQMLMERGFSEEALARLRRLQEDPALPDAERVELVGHLGRIHKDRFLAAAREGDEQAARASLAAALEAYVGWYRSHPETVWHGVNAMALLARPEAAAVAANASAEARSHAKAVLGEILTRDPGLADPYSPANMVEAHVALGEYPAALDAMRRQLAHPEANGFGLGALLRQLTEVWQLDRRPSPGPEIVDILRAGLMQHEGGVVQMSGNDVRRARQAATGAKAEAVFGGDRFDSLENYRRGLERSACVARIGRTVETGVGTGFVVPGSQLSAKLGDAFVLVTNAHVVSDDEAARKEGALHHAEAVVTFAALDDVAPDKELGIAEILFSSPPDRLDVTVARLSEPVMPRFAAPLAPVLPHRGAETQVRVVGHPSGRGLSFSVNRLLDHEVPKVHYQTATEGGSSGSPVFTHDWKLLAVHHAGGDAMPRLNGAAGTYQANEGLWIGAIRDAVHEALP
jgi:hypothetical protein